jgi:hypothetical protein
LAKFPGIRKGDWKAITFCVFAAVTFWFFNAMNINYSIDVTHPLVIHYDEEQYTPLEELPKEIRFSTTASGWDIFTKTNFINSSPIEVDLDDFKKRRYITGARIKNIVSKQMSGIQINEVLDDTIYVYFDKLKSKKIKLQVDAKKLDILEGYKLAGAIIVEPSEVTVTGAASLLKKIPDTYYLKIDEKELSGKFDEKVFVSKDKDTRLKWSADKVSVQFETYSLSKVKVDLELFKINFPKKKKINLSESTVQLIYFAKEENLEEIEKQKLEAVVNFDNLNEKDKTIKVTLKKVPDFINNYYFEPKTVKISYGE